MIIEFDHCRHPLLGSIELNNASLHPFFRPIRHDAPRRKDLKSIADYLERAGLFGADPFRVPGNFDLGNPLVTFDAVQPVSN
jgi:hypothetical protein